jgi:hypothetical protein
MIPSILATLYLTLIILGFLSKLKLGDVIVQKVTFLVHFLKRGETSFVDQNYTLTFHFPLLDIKANAVPPHPMQRPF